MKPIQAIRERCSSKVAHESAVSRQPLNIEPRFRARALGYLVMPQEPLVHTDAAYSARISVRRLKNRLGLALSLDDHLDFLGAVGAEGAVDVDVGMRLV